MSKPKNDTPRKKMQISIQNKIKIYTAIGAIIIFSSWVAQSYFQAKWHSDVEELERNKLAIAFNEINKNIFQFFLNTEESHVQADTNYNSNLLYAYYAYVKYANLLQALGTSIATDNESFKKENDDIANANIKDIDQWYRTKQIDKIRGFAGKLSDWEKNNGDNTINSYQTRLNELRDKENLWNKIYLILYGLGAIFFAWAFLLNYKLTSKST